MTAPMRRSLLVSEFQLVAMAIRKAFGPPGDYGYETPKGRALNALFDLYNATCAKPEVGAEQPSETAPLQDRLAACLAEVIDKPVLTLRDHGSVADRPLEIFFGSFRPDVSEQACHLLEEAGL